MGGDLDQVGSSHQIVDLKIQPRGLLDRLAVGLQSDEIKFT